jgi:hypothetical protein
VHVGAVKFRSARQGHDFGKIRQGLISFCVLTDGHLALAVVQTAYHVSLI